MKYSLYQRNMVIFAFIFLFSFLICILFRKATPGNERNFTYDTTPSPVFIAPTSFPTKWWIKATVSASRAQVSVMTPTNSAQILTGNCPSNFSSPLLPGIFAYISLTPALPNRIHAGAVKASAYLGQVYSGEGVKIIDGPLCADGFSWWLVEAVEDGLRGWTVTGSNSEQWVIPCPNPLVVCKMTPMTSQVTLTTDPTATQNNNQDTCNSDRFSTGMLAEVKPDNLLVIRSEPYIGSVIGHAGPVSVVQIVDGPACAGGAIWWKVKITALKLSGWATEANLRRCSKEDNCS